MATPVCQKSVLSNYYAIIMVVMRTRGPSKGVSEIETFGSGGDVGAGGYDGVGRKPRLTVHAISNHDKDHGTEELGGWLFEDLTGSVVSCYQGTSGTRLLTESWTNGSGTW